MLEPIREVLSFLFNDILAPIIGIFIQWAVNFLIYLLRIVFQELLVRLMVLLCRVVFLIEQMFKIFSGLAMVTANEYNGAALVKTTKMRLLDYFFQINGITTVLMAVTLVSVILTFLFAAYETAKSVNDVTLNEQNAKPVSVVLKNALKSMLGFGLIPVLCVTLLQFSAAILQSVIEVFAAPDVSVLKGESTDIATVIFYMAVQDAAEQATTVSVYQSGRGKLAFSEDADFRSARRIIEFLNSPHDLAATLEKSPQHTAALIGKENSRVELANYSLLSARYKIDGSPSGVTALITPLRTDYARNFALLECVADCAGELIDELTGIKRE